MISIPRIARINRPRNAFAGGLATEARIRPSAMITLSLSSSRSIHVPKDFRHKSSDVRGSHVAHRVEAFRETENRSLEPPNRSRNIGSYMILTACATMPLRGMFCRRIPSRAA